MWRQQLKPNEHGVNAANEKEDTNRAQIKQGDPLVVLSQQPGLQAVLGIEIIDL